MRGSTRERIAYFGGTPSLPSLSDRLTRTLLSTPICAQIRHHTSGYFKRDVSFCRFILYRNRTRTNSEVRDSRPTLVPKSDNRRGVRDTLIAREDTTQRMSTKPLGALLVMWAATHCAHDPPRGTLECTLL